MCQSSADIEPYQARCYLLLCAHFEKSKDEGRDAQDFSHWMIPFILGRFSVQP